MFRSRQVECAVFPAWRFDPRRSLHTAGGDSGAGTLEEIKGPNVCPSVGRRPGRSGDNDGVVKAKARERAAVSQTFEERQVRVNFIAAEMGKTKCDPTGSSCRLRRRSGRDFGA